MFHHQTISAYLGKPNTHAHGQNPWNGFRTQFIEIRRENPRIFTRTLAALLLWSTAVGTVQSIASLSTSQTLSPHVAFANPAIASTVTSPSSTQNASFAAIVHASILPSGPTGQPLPPGTIAPNGTYPNHYATGQCTWYVAGRRQIPSNWGNAVSWYYHATDSGWAVGTVPAVGAVAWTPSGYYGHVALVEQVSAGGNSVYISEMNNPRKGVKDWRWVSAKSFKYIY